MVRAQKAAVAHCCGATARVPDDVVDVAGAAPTVGPAAAAVVTEGDGSALGGGPDGRAPADVERFAGALEDMADDGGVAGPAFDGLGSHRRPVDELGPSRAHAA